METLKRRLVLSISIHNEEHGDSAGVKLCVLTTGQAVNSVGIMEVI